jgi:hypothetical protein
MTFHNIIISSHKLRRSTPKQFPQFEAIFNDLRFQLNRQPKYYQWSSHDIPSCLKTVKPHVRRFWRNSPWLLVVCQETNITRGGLGRWSHTTKTFVQHETFPNLDIGVTVSQSRFGGFFSGNLA